MRSGEYSERFKDILRADNARFIIGLCVLGASLFLLLSIVSNFFTGREDQGGVQSGTLTHAANYGGTLGAYLSNYFMDKCFGVVSVFIPLFTFLVGVKLMGAYRVRLWKWFLNFSIVMIWGSVFLSLVTNRLPESIVNEMSFRLGGGHGDYIKDYLATTIGEPGAWIVILATLVFYLMYLSSETVNVVRRLLHPQDFIKIKPKDKNVPAETPDESSPEPDGTVAEQSQEPEEGGDEDDEAALQPEVSEGEEGAQTFVIDLAAGPSETLSDEGADDMTVLQPQQPEAAEDLTLDIVPTETDSKAQGRTVEEVKEMEPYDPRKDLEFYKFPTISLLKHYDDDGRPIDEAEHLANKNRIITVLRNFGVEISSIKATVGPTITLYEVTPAPGVRINKIRNLEDDIALSLSALGIRIIAPIPGKGTIGIEVPNKNPRIVSMESILNTRKFQETTYELPIALGKTITNEVFMVDLAKMPHLLVAGATGQGKSVGLNAIITSLLYKKHPAELKFVMVDPK